MRRPVSSVVFSLCLIALLSFASSWAQRETGSLGGTVQDETGAVLPGADVAVTNQATGVTRRVITAENGRFVVTNLIPGNYTVRIEMPGFQAFEQTDIPVESARDIRERYVLQVGQVTETVTVQGGATLVSTVSSEQRAGIDNVQVAELPMSTRNVTSIIGLNPAIVARGGEYGGTGTRGFRLSGVGQSSARYTMDGIEASGQSDGNNISQYQGTNRVDVISTDAVQEVQVIKGIVPAEHANTISGVINVISKSGTQEFHGSLFYLYQTQGLNGKDPFLQGANPTLVFNQFGGSLGGPLYTGGADILDSAFFFFAFEGYEERRGVRRQSTVPTQFARDQILASPNFTDRERQIMQAILNPLPVPNRPDTIDERGLGGLLVNPRASEGSDKTWILKNDVHFGDGSQLAFTWNRLDPDFIRPGVVRLDDRIWSDGNNRFATSYFASLGTNWSLESRFGLSLVRQDRADLNFVELLDPVIPEVDFGFRRLPEVEVPEFSTIGGELRRAESATWNIDQKAGYISGNHSVKFGGNYRFRGGIGINPEVPAMDFVTFEDLLANRMDRVSFSFGQPNHDSRIFNFGFFVQDDWRVTQNLTLNLGLRYDFLSNFIATRNTGSRNPTPRGIEPQLLNLTPPRDWAIFDFGPPLDAFKPFEHDKMNFSPRLGFNWDTSGEGTTVLRGGFGMMHMPLTIGLFRNSIQDRVIPRRSTFSRAEIEQFDIRVGTLNAEAADIVRAVVAGQAPIPQAVFPPDLRAPYTMNWTLGVQRELFQDAVLEVDYVGQRGVKFPLERNPNQPDRLTGIRPNPDLPGLGLYKDDSQTMTYHGLQTGFRKRFTDRLAYGVSYSWGQSIALSGGDIGTTYDSDNATCCQDFDNIALARGRANGDIAQNFTANWYYQLPDPAGGAARNVLGGWNFSGIVRAQTGVPIGIDQRNNGGRGRQRGDVLVSNFDDAKFDDFEDTLQFWNPAAFAPVPLSAANVPIRPGNTNRAFLTGPGYWTVDFAFGKDIFVSEGVRVRFRWDWINAFNHFNHANPRDDVDRSRFGQIESFQQNMRVTQLNLRITF